MFACIFPPSKQYILSLDVSIPCVYTSMANAFLLLHTQTQLYPYCVSPHWCTYATSPAAPWQRSLTNVSSMTWYALIPLSADMLVSSYLHMSTFCWHIWGTGFCCVHSGNTQKCSSTCSPVATVTDMTAFAHMQWQQKNTYFFGSSCIQTLTQGFDLVFVQKSQGGSDRCLKWTEFLLGFTGLCVHFLLVSFVWRLQFLVTRFGAGLLNLSGSKWPFRKHR